MAGIRKAVFPVGGLGTRFLPATKSFPKEMLPVVDKPLIQYAVEEALASGIEQMILVTARGKSTIEDHFDVSFELQHVLGRREKADLLEEMERIANLASFLYLRQKEALGLGHAVMSAHHAVGQNDFAVILSDDLILAHTPCLKQLARVYEAYRQPVVAVCRVEPSTVSRYGIVAVEEVEERVFQVRNMVEKPKPEEAPSNLAIIGRYILTWDIFDILEETPPDARGEIQLTDGMRTLLQRRPIYACEFEGTRFDAGDKLGFLMANVAYALEREDLAEPLRQYLKALHL